MAQPRITADRSPAPLRVGQSVAGGVAGGRGPLDTAPAAVRIGAMGASPGPARRSLHRGCRA